MKNEIAFEMAASSIRFGPGVTREVGMDLADLGARKVLVITDPVLADMPPVQTVLESLDGAGVQFVLYDGVRVEPTDESFLDAIAFARQAHYDAYVAVGGGSTIDTAKAVNLYADCHPDHGRNGQRDHGRQHFRSDSHARENRHRKPAAEADAGSAGSGEHAQHAAASGCFERPGYSEPRHRIVYRAAVQRAALSGPAAGAPGVPRVESDQRHLVFASLADGGAV